MKKLSLNKAAKEVGKAKATLLDAIRNGHLTAPKNSLGNYEIDPSELFRVYPKTVIHDSKQSEKLLQVKLEAAEKRIEELTKDKEDWRKLANILSTNQALLLTDQTEKSKIEQAPETKKSEKRTWYDWLLKS